MYKRLLLCLLLTSDLYPAEKTESDNLKAVMTSTLVMLTCIYLNPQQPKNELASAALVGTTVTIGALFAGVCALESKEFEEYFSKLSYEDARKKIEDIKTGFIITEVIMMMFATVYAVAALQPIVKDTYEFIYPTEEQKAIEEAAGKRLKIYKAEEKFKDCLMKHKPGCEKNDAGRPDDCEEIAQMLIAVGGADQADTMSSDFKEYWK